MESLASGATQQQRLPGMGRDYRAERESAMHSRVERLALLREGRTDGTMGEEFAKLAQFAILCSLPYGRTKDRYFTRQSRLSDGSVLKVTFAASRPDRELPFGGDRSVYRWLFHEALTRKSGVVPWDNGARYLRDMGMSDCGKNRKDLRERFLRLSALSVSVERKDRPQGVQSHIFESWNLPASLDGQGGTDEEQYQFVLSPTLWREIQENNVALPRQLLLGLKGSWRVQDAILWLCYRLYGAQRESGIAWEQLASQLPQEDSNLWRFRQVFREAVAQLKVFWPEAGVSVESWGLQLSPSSRPLLADDPSRNRQRRLPPPRLTAVPGNRTSVYEKASAPTIGAKPKAPNQSGMLALAEVIAEQARQEK